MLAGAVFELLIGVLLGRNQLKLFELPRTWYESWKQCFLFFSKKLLKKLYRRICCLLSRNIILSMVNTSNQQVFRKAGSLQLFCHSTTDKVNFGQLHDGLGKWTGPFPVIMLKGRMLTKLPHTSEKANNLFTILPTSPANKPQLRDTFWRLSGAWISTSLLWSLRVLFLASSEKTGWKRLSFSIKNPHEFPFKIAMGYCCKAGSAKTAAEKCFPLQQLPRN